MPTPGADDQESKNHAEEANAHLQSADQYTADAEKKYPEILKKYGELHAQNPGAEPSQTFHQALVDIYGDKADQVGAQIARDIDQKYIFEAGENFSQARDALKDAGLNNLNNRLKNKAQDVFRIKQTRDALTHPEQPELMQLDADAYPKVAESTATAISDTIKAAREAVVPPEKQAAKDLAIQKLEAMQADLQHFHKPDGYRLTAANDIAPAEMEKAVEMREIKAGSHAAAAKQSLKNAGNTFDQHSFDGHESIDVYPGVKPGDHPVDALHARRNDLAHLDPKPEQRPGALDRAKSGQTLSGKLSPDNTNGHVNHSAANGHGTDAPPAQTTEQGPQMVPPPPDQGHAATARNAVTINGGGAQRTSGANALKTQPQVETVPHPGPVLVPSGQQSPGEPAPPKTNKIVKMPVRPGTPMADELHGAAPKPASAGLGRTASAGTSGYLTYSGVMQTGKGLEELHHGQKLKGGADLGLGITSTGAGTIGAVEAIAPGTLERVAGQTLGRSIAKGLERGVPLLVAAQAGIEIATAPDGQRLNAAYRAGGTLGAAAAASALTTEGTVGAVAWPIAAATGAGLAIDRGITLSELRKNHDAAMAAIKPDDAHSHLRAAADQLGNTLVVAQFGDTLAKDKNGNVDIDSRKNLDAIKAALPEETRKAIAAQSMKDAEAFVDQQRYKAMGETGVDPYSEKQAQDFKNSLAKDDEKAVLQSKAIEVQQAMDARQAYFPKDAKLALDANGKVALTNENLGVMREVLQREHDAAAKGAAESNQSHPYWNWNGEGKLTEHCVLEERQKTIDAALTELKQAQQGGKPEQQTLDIAALEAKAKEMAKANGGKQDIETVHTYKVGDANEPSARDMYQQYLKQYQADPQHRAQQDIKQVLYKDDGHGHKVADKVVVWEVMDPAALKKAAEAAQGAKSSGASYDGEHHTAPQVSGSTPAAPPPGRQQPAVPGH